MREQQEFIFRKKLFIEDCIFDIHIKKRGYKRWRGGQGYWIVDTWNSKNTWKIGRARELNENDSSTLQSGVRCSGNSEDRPGYGDGRKPTKWYIPFGRKGWIEIREMEKTGKDGLDKEYILKVRLGRIVDYFAQERLERSARAESSFSMPKIPVLT